jgi:SAM-dependent methyltransferase
MRPKLRKAPPSDRTYEQLKNHYQVEKALAARLRRSTREQRKEIYATMYDELFRQVPDHPRLTKREDERLTLLANRGKFALLRRYIDKTTVFAEFAPGDCQFAIEVAKHVKQAYGIDISDQRKPGHTCPDNFELFLYDGSSFDGIPGNTVDVFFSDYLIEHLHPDETRSHFEIVYRLLKKGGRYIFRTPHALTGPHDISQYFCEEPEGFHLKEWTHTELRRLIGDIGFSRYVSYWSAKGMQIRSPVLIFEGYEKIAGFFPRRLTRRLSRLTIPLILCEVVR